MAKTRAELELRATDKATGVFKRFNHNINNLNRTLRKSERRFQLFSRRVDRSLGSINKLGKKMNRVGRDMTTRLSLPIAAMGGLALNEFRKFEKGLISVGKTTNMAGKELKFVGDQVQAMSKRMPLSADQLLELTSAAGQMGIRGTKNLLAFTETMAKLQFTTDVAGEEGARAIARILTVTGEGPGKVKPFADTLVYLGNTLAATESEILGVANRISGNVSRFKLGSNEILALAGSLKALGKESELAGSVTGKVFNSIQQAILDGGKNQEGLKTLRILTGGISKEDLKKRFDTKPMDLFIQVMKGLQKVSTSKSGNFVKVIKNLGLEGVRVNNILGTLVTALDSVEGKINEIKANKQLQALNTEFEQFNKSFDADIKKTMNSLKSLAIVIGKELTPMFRGFLSGVRGFAQFFEDHPTVRRMAIALAGFVAIAGPILATLGGMAIAFVGINKFLPLTISLIKDFTKASRFGKAFELFKSGRLLSGISALLGPFGALAFAIWSVYEAVQAVKNAWPDLRNATLESTIDYLKFEFGNIADKIKTITGGIVDINREKSKEEKRFESKSGSFGGNTGRSFSFGPPGVRVRPPAPNALTRESKARLEIEVKSDSETKTKVKSNSGFDAIDIVRGFQGAKF